MRRKVSGVGKDFTKILRSYNDKNLDISGVRESKTYVKEIKKLRRKLAKSSARVSDNLLKNMLIDLHRDTLDELGNIEERNERFEILQEFLFLIEEDLKYFDDVQS